MRAPGPDGRSERQRAPGPDGTSERQRAPGPDGSAEGQGTSKSRGARVRARQGASKRGGAPEPQRPPVSQRPPRLVAWVLARLSSRPIRNHLVGDLEQEFGERVRRSGRRGAAVRWYLGQAARSLPPLLRERLAGGLPVRAIWSPTDLRLAVRSLRRSPTFTLVAVITLAVGIGANTLVFTFVHGMLVAPLPVREPGRLYMIQQTRADGATSSWLSVPDFRDLRDGARSFQEMAAVTPDAFIVEGAGDPQYLGGAEVTFNYFDVLGVPPVAGRLFGPEDDAADRVVIAEAFWSRSFGRDAAAVGSIVELDGRPMEIVGVVPDRADVLGDMELWVPIRTSIAGWRQSRGTDWVFALGRLAPEASPEAAEAELEGLGSSLAEAFPETNAGQGFAAESLKERIIGSFRAPLLVLMGAVALVLVIVCVNLAGLLLTRGMARGREMAMLIALGAGRGRLVARLFTESLLLALAGGGLGLGIARYGVPLLRGLVPAGAPRVEELAINMPVLLFSGTLCLGATLVFGLVPAWSMARRGAGGALARGAGRDRTHALLRSGLVASQIALALVLLVGTSLLLRSFVQLYAVDLGIRTEGVVTVRLPLVDARFPSTGERTRHYGAILEAVRNAPGIDDAALVNALPLRDSGPTFSFTTSETIAVAEQERLAGFRAVMGDYFGVMGIDVLAGRRFTADELQGATPAVVVDRAFERAFFPDGALGKHIETAGALRPIVGVVEVVPEVSLTATPRPKMYVPLSADLRQTMIVVAASPLSPAGGLDALRAALRAADPQQTIQSPLPMTGYLSRSVQQQRMVLSVLAAMAILALFLAALGTYGMLSYLVSQRTQEIGVRMALGATRASVRAMVLASGAKMVAVGLLAGAALAAAGGRFLGSLLFETPALDPLSYLAAGSVLVLVALLGSYLPALRATCVSPVEALRSD